MLKGAPFCAPEGKNVLAWSSFCCLYTILGLWLISPFYGLHLHTVFFSSTDAEILSAFLVRTLVIGCSAYIDNSWWSLHLRILKVESVSSHKVRFNLLTNSITHRLRGLGCGCTFLGSAPPPQQCSSIWHKDIWNLLEGDSIKMNMNEKGQKLLIEDDS